MFDSFFEHALGVAATYYFRAVPESWDEGVIREIARMGHEVGYHYENLSSVVRRRRSDFRGQMSEVGGRRSVAPGKAWSVGIGGERAALEIR